MPCRGSGGRGESLGARQWENWAGTLRFRPLQTFRPSTLEQLVAVVGDAHDRRMRVRAVGSSWSYTDVAVSDNVQVVVETDRLRRVLTGGAASPDAIVPGALNAGAARDAGHLVHVEAGIKIEELNCVLDARGLAMPTLGGDRGQSLLGAISTATHGADVALPPIADAVQAIHLVGPGGREWWIERAAPRSITDPARMADLRRRGRLCSDLILEYDDTTFNAVLVSMGRLGIVYSVVLRARDAFRLRETRDQMQWSMLERTLRRPGPEAPVRAFNSRFVEIVFNPYRNARGDHDCVLTRRSETTAPETARVGNDSPFTLLCRSRDLAGTIRPMLAAVDAAAAATFGFLLLIPFVGPVAFAVATTTFVTLRVALEGLLASLGTGADLGQALARVCNLAAATGQSWIVRDLVGAMVGQIRGPLPGGFAVDKSFKLMTSQPGCENLGEGPPHCMRQIDGMEIAFDARAGRHGYIDFVNEVASLVEELLRRNRPVGVALSLRFTGRSEALLAMQQFDTTCSIEVIILRGLPGNDEFVRRLETLAYDRGGIPHWGLIHHVTRAQVNRFYGERLTTWRQVLMRMVERSGGRVDTFSTRYSVEHDLEPLPSCTLPPELGNFLVRILRALAEALARRRSMTGGGMSGGRGSGGSGSGGSGRGGGQGAGHGGGSGQGGGGQGGGAKPPE